MEAGKLMAGLFESIEALKTAGTPLKGTPRVSVV
jgi:hypothetical protein